MPVDVSLHPDFDNVIIFASIGSVTIKEIHAGIDKLYMLRREAGLTTTHTIYDSRRLSGLPEGLISNFSYFVRRAQKNPHKGLNIIVGARGFGEVAMGIFSKVYQKVQIVPTMEEAFEMIREADTKKTG